MKNQQRQKCKSFLSNIDENSEILILGSMPGVKSLEEQQSMKKLNCDTIEDLYQEVKARYEDSEQVSKISLDLLDTLKVVVIDFTDDTRFIISKYEDNFFIVIFNSDSEKDDSGIVSAEEVLLNIEKEIEIL